MNITSTIPTIPFIGTVINAEALRPQFNNNLNNNFSLPPTSLDMGGLAPYGFNPLIQGAYGVDQGILATLGIGLDYAKLGTPNINSTSTNSVYEQAFKLERDELRSLSFDSILDQPHSINSLFSEEMKDLVKNLVEMQKQKLAFSSGQNDNVNNFSTINNPSEASNLFNLNPTENHSQPNLQINHLLSNSQADIIQKEKTNKRSTSQRPKQAWDEQSETPYSTGKKKQGKSLAKTILSSLGKGLEKVSRVLQEASN